MSQVKQYGLGTEVMRSFDAAVESVRAELAKEGFGVLTEIDMKATLAKKLGVEFRPYTIIGACNPPLAAKALEADIDIGLLLPCNVVVYTTDEPGRCAVVAIDPVAQLGITGNTEIEPLAQEVRAKLERVLDRLSK
jgi:uncharacterized protein (DUF302 family)